MNINRVTAKAEKTIPEFKCGACNKLDVVRAETRLAETPAAEQQIENASLYCRAYQAIGITYLHSNGSLCDKPLYKLVRL